MVSTRNRDKNVTYNVGDRVEIVRPGNLDVGILLSKADESGRDSPSSNSSTTHWLVSVEGNSNEEDISERYLGRILPPREDEETPAASNNGRATSGRRSPRNPSSDRAAAIAAASRKPSTRQDSKANSTDEENGEDGGHSSSSGNEKSGAGAVTAATSSKSKKNARGGRQAKKTAHKKGATQAKASSASDTAAAANSAPARKYATRRGKGDGQELFEGIDVDKIKNKKKVRVPAPKAGPDETVIKVKMLTGTLYLYRGLRPRAEFVRVV